MSNFWLDRAKKRLRTEDQNPDMVFERLQVQGFIDEQGVPTGEFHRWDAFLAIIEVKRIGNSKQIEAFRCLKPVFGLPGGDTIDIRRNSMVTYLKEGKKIITARRDDRLGIWREGCDVHLSGNGWILCQSTDDTEDNVGGLPEFQHTDSRF